MLGLSEIFFSSAGRWPERTAVDDGISKITYAELSARVARLASRIARTPAGQHNIEAFLCPRGADGYAALLAIMACGRAYLPLHPKWPAARLQAVLEQARPGNIISAREFNDLDLGRWPRITCEDVPGKESEPVPNPTGSAAYLMFTSGSSGEPKGILIRHGQAAHYLAAAAKVIPLFPEDRVSQVFDLGFDLSVHDMFSAWSAGACLVTVSDREAYDPKTAVVSKKMSVWFSTPSVAAQGIARAGITPGSMPGLRESLFCGEALPVSVAEAWRAAAPASRLHNLYGPTEATVAISSFTIMPGAAAPQSPSGILPIGRVFPPNEFELNGGELCLRGPQVIASYFRPDTGKESFLPGGWYRTGDRTEISAGGDLLFLGRRDDQLKVRGFRIEPAEIIKVLGDSGLSSRMTAVTLPGPPQPSEMLFIVFEGAEPADAVKLEWMERCREKLPEYMVPFDIFGIESLPLNTNGKMDTAALRVFVNKRLNG